MRSEDQVYAELCLEVDPDKKQVLLEELTPLVSKHAYAVSWLVLQETRPDVVNETLEAVLRQLPTFKGRSKFSTWVEAITRNICNRKLRYRIRHRKDVPLDDLELPLFQSYARAPLRDMIKEQERVHSKLELENIRESLTPEDKTLLDGMLQGESYEDLRNKLALESQSAVRTKWHRLKKRIVKELTAV